MIILHNDKVKEINIVSKNKYIQEFDNYLKSKNYKIKIDTSNYLFMTVDIVNILNIPVHSFDIYKCFNKLEIVNSNDTILTKFIENLLNEYQKEIESNNFLSFENDIYDTVISDTTYVERN